MLGPDELRIPEHGRAETPVAVAIVPVAGGPRVTAEDGPALLAKGIVEHPVRNRRVVKLAKAVAASDRDVLAREFAAVEPLVEWADGGWS